MNLTPRQLEVLQLICEFRDAHGYAPTMAEMAGALSVSPVTVYEHVVALEKKGAIRRTPNQARSIEVVAVPGPGADSARGEASAKLPFLGYIAAGKPIEAIEDREEIDVSEVLTDKGDTFVLQVRGDSMIEDHIQDGDYVICRRQATASDGETVVALIDGGEATLKRIYREGRRIRLQSANPDYPPIYTTDVDIQGVVVGVLRRY
jgi:repressor LexA